MQRIMATFPEAVIAVVLRDPVRRAVSNYRFTRQHGHEERGLPEALRASTNDERAWDRRRFSVSPYAYLPRGRYIDYLEDLARHVPPEQRYVVVFEELVTSADVVAALYRRLGVESSFRPSGFDAVVNASEGHDEEIEPEFAEWLAEYYREPNCRLEQLLDRPLPWQRPGSREDPPA
jgi:hypothetical protein